MNIQQAIQITSKYNHQIFYTKISKREDFYTLSVKENIDLAQSSTNIHIWLKLINHPNLILTDDVLLTIIHSRQYNVYVTLITSEKYIQLSTKRKYHFIKQLYVSVNYNLFKFFARDLTVPIENLRNFAAENAADNNIFDAIMCGMCGRSDFPIKSAINYTKVCTTTWLEILGRLDYPLNKAIIKANIVNVDNIVKRQDFQTLPIDKLIEICEKTDCVLIWCGVCKRTDYPIEKAIQKAEWFINTHHKTEMLVEVANRFI